MSQFLGVSDLDAMSANDLLASVRPARTLDIVVKSGEGVLARGTIMSLEVATGKYKQWNGTVAKAGILGDDIDATSADVKTYLLFDIDVNSIAVFGLTTVNIGFDQASLINFK